MFALDTPVELPRLDVELTMDDYKKLIEPKIKHIRQFFVAVCNTSKRYFSERDIHNYIVCNFVHTDCDTRFISPVCCYIEKLIIDMYVTLLLKYNSNGAPTISELSVACDVLRYFLRIRCSKFNLDSNISSTDIASSLDKCLSDESKLKVWVDELLVIDSNVNNMFPIAYYFYYIYNTSSLDLDYRTIKNIWFDESDVEHPKVAFADAINILFGSDDPLEKFDDTIFYDLFRVTPDKELIPRFYIDRDLINDLNDTHDVHSYNMLVDKYSARYKRKAPVTYLLAFELYRRFVLNNGDCDCISDLYTCDYGDIKGMINGTCHFKYITYIGQPRVIKHGDDVVVIPECIHTVLRPNLNHGDYKCFVDLPEDLMYLVDNYYDVITNEWFSNITGIENVFEHLNAIASCDMHLLSTVLQCMQFKHEMSYILGANCIFSSRWGFKYYHKQFFGDSVFLGNYISTSRVKDLSDEDKLAYIDDHISNYNKLCSKLNNEAVYDRHNRRKAELLSNLYKLKRNLPSMAAFVIGVLVDKGATVILVGIVISCILLLLLNNINVAVLSEKIWRIKSRKKKG